jgi:predicted transcriptional regulator
MSDDDRPATLATLTAEIVTSYVRGHQVACADVPRLIAIVGQELAVVGRRSEPPPRPEPMVPVRRSIQREHLVCLACGRRLKAIRRHLTTAHGLTPASYREMFGLRADYPMVAPAYAERRAVIAAETGFGRPAGPAAAEATQAPARKRGRPRRRPSEAG